MTELARHRPADLMQVWSKMLCPAPPADQAPSPDGKPPLHEVLLSIALYLEAHLTPAQTTQLQHDWAAYQAAVTRAREARVAAAASLQYGAALHGVNWQKQATLATGGSTAERSEVRSGRGGGQARRGLHGTSCEPPAHARPLLPQWLTHTRAPTPAPCWQAYLLMAEGTGCLASLGTEELLAMVDLQVSLFLFKFKNNKRIWSARIYSIHPVPVMHPCPSRPHPGRPRCRRRWRGCSHPSRWPACFWPRSPTTLVRRPSAVLGPAWRPACGPAPSHLLHACQLAGD